MGYFWKERGTIYSELVIDPSLAIDFKIILFFVGLAALSYSIITGLFLSVSRLYDLRLTSNILLTRKRALKKGITFTNSLSSNNCICDPANSLDKYKCRSIKCLWKVFWHYDEYSVSDDDIKGNKEKLKNKFITTKRLSKNIGKLSWILMNNQTISLLISIIFFMVVLIINEVNL